MWFTSNLPFFLIQTAEVSLLRITATELIGGVSGESEEKITEVFEQAASLAPCVLLIEKIEVVAPKLMSAKSMEKRIGAQLSSCLNSECWEVFRCWRQWIKPLMSTVRKRNFFLFCFFFLSFSDISVFPCSFISLLSLFFLSSFSFFYILSLRYMYS